MHQFYLFFKVLSFVNLFYFFLVSVSFISALILVISLLLLTLGFACSSFSLYLMCKVRFVIWNLFFVFSNLKVFKKIDFWTLNEEEVTLWLLKFSHTSENILTIPTLESGEIIFTNITPFMLLDKRKISCPCDSFHNILIYSM